MNASKFLVSTAAAVAVAGSIGIAYAQTTPATDPAMTTTPSTMPATGTTPTPASTDTMPATEPAPQADRN